MPEGHYLPGSSLEANMGKGIHRIICQKRSIPISVKLTGSPQTPQPADGKQVPSNCPNCTFPWGWNLDTWNLIDKNVQKIFYFYLLQSYLDAYKYERKNISVFGCSNRSFLIIWHKSHCVTFNLKIPHPNFIPNHRDLASNYVFWSVLEKKRNSDFELYIPKKGT